MVTRWCLCCLGFKKGGEGGVLKVWSCGVCGFRSWHSSSEDKEEGRKEKTMLGLVLYLGRHKENRKHFGLGFLVKMGQVWFGLVFGCGSTQRKKRAKEKWWFWLSRRRKKEKKNRFWFGCLGWRKKRKKENGVWVAWLIEQEEEINKNGFLFCVGFKETKGSMLVL